MMTHHDLFFLEPSWQYHNQVATLLLHNPWYHSTHFPSWLLRRTPSGLVSPSVMSGHVWWCLSPFFLAVRCVCLPPQEFFMVPLILLATAVLWCSQCKFLLWQLVEYNCLLFLEVSRTLHLAASASHACLSN